MFRHLAWPRLSLRVKMFVLAGMLGFMAAEPIVTAGRVGADWPAGEIAR